MSEEKIVRMFPVGGHSISTEVEPESPSVVLEVNLAKKKITAVFEDDIPEDWFTPEVGMTTRQLERLLRTDVWKSQFGAPALVFQPNDGTHLIYTVYIAPPPK